MIHLNISQLKYSCAGEGFPALAHIPAMQRRRLSSIAKLALNSAIECLNQGQVDYIVWASQYGDEHKTYKILEDVLQDITPSPTQFSTSVHNAIAGLYSILCQDATPSTSLCASWSEAVIEAYAYLKTVCPQGRAMVVYYDEALPEVYSEHQDFEGFALAALVDLSSSSLRLNEQGLLEIEPKYLEAKCFYNFWTQPSQQNYAAWSRYS
ncbi:beta-ketoacyl synthase chain length factor [Acinetobacter sp. Marseille-Q1618]|uniref:beta-ketoacyl synthase chain length factor n=1 Tax=Acinetobacter sp. Marseille-Q1618 TaxID=2697502 RepID=UPI001570CBDA|nr:beta-ketoacyl synthase chain length factor [Acinetobacter sp. Marseille-Q1618]